VCRASTRPPDRFPPRGALLQLATELERYRHLPDEFGACPEGYEPCVAQGGGSNECSEYSPCICVPLGECLGGGGEDDGGVTEPPPWIDW